MPSRRATRAHRDEELEDLHQTILAAGAAQQQASTPRSTLVDMSDLVEALRSTQGRKDSFKPPHYNGEGDVELFISQFLDVARANEWPNYESTLHLRSVLSGKALECGQGTTMDEILDELRSSFGMTDRQARDRLRSYHKSSKQSWREVGKEISTLVKRAYRRLDPEDQEDMALDVFTKGLDKQVQRHFLLKPPANMKDAVQMVEDYLQVGGDSRQPKVNAVETEQMAESEQPLSVEKVSDFTTMLTQTLSTMQQMMELQTATLTTLQNLAVPRHQPKEKKELSCYICKGPHVKRNCPQQVKEQPKSDNSNGPAQLRAQLGRDQGN